MSRRGGVKRGAALLLAALLAGAAARAQDGADEAPVRDVRVIVDDEGRPIAELGMLPTMADGRPAGRGNQPWGFELRVREPGRYRTVEVELELSQRLAPFPASRLVGSIAGAQRVSIRGRRPLEAGGVCSFVWLVPLSGRESFSEVEHLRLRLDGVATAERLGIRLRPFTGESRPLAGVLASGRAEAGGTLARLKVSLPEVWQPEGRYFPARYLSLPRFSRIWPQAIVHWSALNLVRFLAYVPPSGRSDP
ncbi:MAG: hypothetical protein D6776_11540, partial [Planctomycetota bacterium]